VQKNRVDLGANGELLIAGSTHKGEDEIVLEVYKELAGSLDNIRLIIAPRHVDRAGYIKKMVEDAGLECVLFSGLNKDKEVPLSGKRVGILDTHGELSELYSLATVVFMGGSLVKRGGHNIVEPARFGEPIVFGPHMFNFRDMASIFLDTEAAVRVMDKAELFKVLENLFTDKAKRKKMGQVGKALVEGQAGATERTIREITHIFTTL